jgi:FkbM family methyltransferase
MGLRSRIYAAAQLPVHLSKLAQQELRAYRAHPVRSEFGFTLRGSAHQGHEPHEVSFIRNQLADSDVLVDVGAYFGLYTCLARSAGVAAVAIEPSPENLRFLYSNLIDNGWVDTTVYPVALGEAPGLRTIYGAGTGASLIAGWAGALLPDNEPRRPHHEPRLSSLETTVPVLTLDSVLRGTGVLGKRLIIKMDVEGAERMVLSGATAALAAEPAPTWMIEVTLSEHHPAGRNPDFSAVFEMFWSAGYKSESFNPRREVTPEHVTEWTAAGRTTFGGQNYAFTRVE